MSKPIILVTGGCGYIGSHTIVELIQAGYHVISVDSLINSDESSLLGVEKITGVKVKNYQLDLAKNDSIQILLEQINNVDGIIHFAALKAVGDSVEKPLDYYGNNLESLINVLKLSSSWHVKGFVFSSSCTVYGETNILPVHEELEFRPTSSPYGRTKQMCEQIISDQYLTKDCSGKGISLRYFNPAGAHHSHLIGESPINIAQNLVPVITEAAIGRRKDLTVFGTDYDTRDGSCIRDYIHVMDLANAHVLAMDSILNNRQEKKLEAYNLGIGQGVSVLEAIHSFEETNKIKLNYKIGLRRTGDLAAIYSDNSKIMNHLNWNPKYSISDIMKDAWIWEQNRSILHK